MNAFASNEHNGNRQLSCNTLYVLITFSCILTVCQTLILTGKGALLVHGLRLSVHAGLPRVPWHVRHGDDQQADPAEEQEDEGSAGACKGPRVVVLDPDGFIAVNHAFDRLSHDFH